MKPEIKNNLTEIHKKTQKKRNKKNEWNESIASENI